MSRRLFCYREKERRGEDCFMGKIIRLLIGQARIEHLFEHVEPEQQNSGFCAHKWLQSAEAFHRKKLRLASLSLLSSPSIPSLSLFQSFYQCLYHSVVLPLCYFIHNTRMHSHFPRRTTLNKGRDVEGFVSGCCFPSVRLLLFKCLHRTAQGLETSLYAVVK